MDEQNEERVMNIMNQSLELAKYKDENHKETRMEKYHNDYKDFDYEKDIENHMKAFMNEDDANTAINSMKPEFYEDDVYKIESYPQTNITTKDGKNIRDYYRQKYDKSNYKKETYQSPSYLNDMYKGIDMMNEVTKDNK